MVCMNFLFFLLLMYEKTVYFYWPCIQWPCQIFLFKPFKPFIYRFLLVFSVPVFFLSSNRPFFSFSCLMVLYIFNRSDDSKCLCLVPDLREKSFYHKFTFFCLFCFLFLFFLSKAFFFISWRLITLQHCSGFCHTLKWISHGFTCVPHPDPPSHLPLHPIPLGLPRAPCPSACLMHPTWDGDLFHPR